MQNISNVSLELALENFTNDTTVTTTTTTFINSTYVPFEYTHLVVYTRSSLAEQTTPTAYDYTDAMVNVSNLTFIDLDLDVKELGGDLTFGWPEDMTHVTEYVSYWSEDAAGRTRVFYERTTPIAPFGRFVLFPNETNATTETFMAEVYSFTIPIGRSEGWLPE